MKNKQRVILIVLLLILGAILAACGGRDSTEKSPIGDKITAEKTEKVADHPNEAPNDAVLGDSRIRSVDGMTLVYVPEGSFPMGRKGGIGGGTPVHEVSLAAFWIDGTEVTNAQYTLCVNDGSCGRSQYADDADYNSDEHPVVGVTWFDAEAYCEWAGGRLPTEAEWEYAARGPQGLTYPWGDKFSGEKSNSCDVGCPNVRRDERVDDGHKLTAAAGSFPVGASWVGALDMSGNVAEWMKDWYDEAYYATSDSNSPTLNPQGPDSGERKVLRGGSWSNTASDLRSATRDVFNPDEWDNATGFRCVVAPGE